MKNKLNIAMAASLVALLSACGGGGGGDDGPNVSSLQGGYDAVSSNGSSGGGVVLENGTFWLISGTESGGSFFVSSLSQGTLTLNGSTVMSSNVRDYDFGSGLTELVRNFVCEA